MGIQKNTFKIIDICKKSNCTIFMQSMELHIHNTRQDSILSILSPNQVEIIVSANTIGQSAPIMARAFEKALSNRVIAYCIEHNIIEPWNCAFQPNKATEDILGCLSQDVFTNFQNGSMTEVGFLDLQSVYDTVWRNGLLYSTNLKKNTIWMEMLSIF